jgi:hypothetical protein
MALVAGICLSPLAIIAWVPTGHHRSRCPHSPPAIIAAGAPPASTAGGPAMAPARSRFAYQAAGRPFCRPHETASHVLQALPGGGANAPTRFGCAWSQAAPT